MKQKFGINREATFAVSVSEAISRGLFGRVDDEQHDKAQ